MYICLEFANVNNPMAANLSAACSFYGSKNMYTNDSYGFDRQNPIDDISYSLKHLADI